ncbi:hypothetical protein BU15DRAFT_67540 [Melanogaster broomeanus]|nr:hypothetical protein BU15DRAFT_67540 [Melanogaster broomeanus]
MSRLVPLVAQPMCRSAHAWGPSSCAVAPCCWPVHAPLVRLWAAHSPQVAHLGVLLSQSRSRRLVALHCRAVWLAPGLLACVGAIVALVCAWDPRSCAVVVVAATGRHHLRSYFLTEFYRLLIVRTLHASHHSLPGLLGVMEREQSMYERSRGKASAASYKRTKEIAKSGGGWARDAEGVHPVLSLMRRARADDVDGHSVDEEREREEKRRAMVRAVGAFRPAETVFELRTRGKAGTVNAALMKERRKALAKAAERTVTTGPSSVAAEDIEVDDAAQGDVTMEMADEDGDVESVHQRFARLNKLSLLL